MKIRVRLTEEQINGIVFSIKTLLKNSEARLYLYGSRTNLEAKGGDIDLLLLVNDEKTKNTLLQEKHKIIANMKKNIGEQKIDLLIATQDTLQDDPFLKGIFPTTVLLHAFS